jgi:hypothetical protein
VFNFLKNHPFPVEAYFDSSLVFTFALPKEILQDRVPKPVKLDTFQDKWAFIAVAMVQTKSLRPKGFPKFLGNDFFLIGYRIFVTYKTDQNKRLRGLYILKSETDRKRMEFLGKLFTHYNYTKTDIHREVMGSREKIQSHKSGFQVEVDFDGHAEIPATSPFSSWKEARRFAGPLPFTFTHNRKRNQMLIVEGKRSNWKPEPVHVLTQDFGFLRENNFQKEAKLASAFVVKNIPYQWKKGRFSK